MSDSTNDAYAGRLKSHQVVWWKRLLNVQAPYRWNLRRMKPGFMLDIGCGLGRNLGHVDGHGVGIDPNRACLAEARTRGLTVYSPEAFLASPHAQAWAFDSILLSHVVEHMEVDAARALIASYFDYLKPGGQLILITPQEAGHASDRTHVHFMDAGELRRLAEDLGLTVTREMSFPFPRWAGRLFRYNEFVLTAAKPG